VVAAAVVVVVVAARRRSRRHHDDSPRSVVVAHGTHAVTGVRVRGVRSVLRDWCCAMRSPTVIVSGGARDRRRCCSDGV